MDKGSKISFIPKKPLVKKVEKSTRPMSLVLFLSLFVFFATLAAYGGAYFYDMRLAETLEEKVKNLEIEKEKADPAGAIERAEEIQAKIKNTKELLGAHIAPTRIFELLEEVTLASVSFDTLTFSGETTEVATEGRPGIASQRNATGETETNFMIELSGIAPSYASLAYQSDVLKREVLEGQRVKEFSLSNVNLDESGNVMFGLEVKLDKAFLLYNRVLDEAPLVNQSAQVLLEEEEPLVDE